MFFQVTIALEISLPDIEIFDYTAFKTICQEMIASLPLAVQRKITDREQKQRAQKTMIDLKHIVAKSFYRQKKKLFM